jgi:hypothetical protein
MPALTWVSERAKDLGNLEIESDGSGTIIAAISPILTRVDDGIEIRILRLELFVRLVFL